MTTTILIVEDHVPLRKLLQSWLKIELAQDYLIEATNSLEAIERAGISMAQVIIVDMDMPQVNGCEVVRSIKAAAPGARLVALALHDDRHHRADAAEAGASAYVAKSALQTELVPTVKALLDRGEM